MFSNSSVVERESCGALLQKVERHQEDASMCHVRACFCTLRVVASELTLHCSLHTGVAVLCQRVGGEMEGVMQALAVRLQAGPNTVQGAGSFQLAVAFPPTGPTIARMI